MCATVTDGPSATHTESSEKITLPPASTGLPGGSAGEESACQCKRRRRHRRLGFSPWVRKIPWRREWQPKDPLQDPCLGEVHEPRNLAGYSPRGHEGSDTP